ncbi:hypothetical protein V493_07604, partial [Pseudogymnoascus sp. VKM F-4281 (FW-2241)]
MSPPGESAWRELLLDRSSGYCGRGRGESSVCAFMGGVSLDACASAAAFSLGGRAGRDLSTSMLSFSFAFAKAAAALLFLRRRAMRDSWQLMQKMPFAAAEAGGAEGLVAGQDGEVLDLVAAGAAAVGAVVADEGAVAEEEKVGVRVEEGVALVAAEAVEMPSV